MAPEINAYNATTFGNFGRDYVFTSTTSNSILGSTIYANQWRNWTTELRNAYADTMLNNKGDIPNMITTDDENRDYVIFCRDKNDLLPDRVLKSISIMKGKLEIDCAMLRITAIECYMTPAVKENVIKAGKRLAMYGKQRPLVARFDEYGRQLPDEISIDGVKGITLKIINADEHGEFYLALKAIADHTQYISIDDASESYSPF